MAEKNINVFQFYLNLLNQICIAIVTVHITWYCIGMIIAGRFTVEYNLHVWLSTIGYQLLMAEAILTIYSNNSWSFFYSSKTKRNLHWIIQVIGSSMAIVGTIILIPGQKSHFKTIHAITGLVSLILAVIALINGIAALWPRTVYIIYRIKPIWSKFFHNFIGISSFVLGMVSLYYGYKYGYFSRDYGLLDVNVDFTPYLMGSVIFTTIASLFGALIALYSQTLSILGG